MKYIISFISLFFISSAACAQSHVTPAAQARFYLLGLGGDLLASWLASDALSDPSCKEAKEPEEIRKCRTLDTQVKTFERAIKTALKEYLMSPLSSKGIDAKSQKILEQAYLAGDLILKLKNITAPAWHLIKSAFPSSASIGLYSYNINNPLNVYTSTTKIECGKQDPFCLRGLPQEDIYSQANQLQNKFLSALSEGSTITFGALFAMLAYRIGTYLGPVIMNEIIKNPKSLSGIQKTSYEIAHKTLSRWIEMKTMYQFVETFLAKARLEDPQNISDEKLIELLKTGLHGQLAYNVVIPFQQQFIENLVK